MFCIDCEDTMSFYHPYPPHQYWPTNATAPPPMQQQPMFMQHAFQSQPYLYSPPPIPSPTMGYYFQPMQQQQPPKPQQTLIHQQQYPHRMPSRCHSAEVLVSKNRMSRPLVPPGHHYPQVKAGNNTAATHPSMATIAEEHRRSLAEDNVPLAILASRNKNQESGRQRRSISYSNLRTNRSSSPNRLVRMDPSCSSMINSPRHASSPANHSGPPSLSSSRFSSTTSSSNSDATSSVGETSSIASSSCPPKQANKPSIAKRLMNRLSRSASTTTIRQHQ